MNIERYAAFTDGERGGNPAGVVVSETLPAPDVMQQIAAEVGYSETAFAAPEGDLWRVRYFAPEIEIPFCGHATIALGAALARHRGPGTFKLRINGGEIEVDGANGSAVLTSLPAGNAQLEPDDLRQCLDLFGFDDDALDSSIPPSLIHAGSGHVLLALASREALADMTYNFDKGRELMLRMELATIMLVYKESASVFHARNAFASGGVYEDPATGSAAAAFAGYLGFLGAEPGGSIEIRQGDDMGMPTRLHATIPEAGKGARVAGSVRSIVP